jgi:hypothetical protein
MVLTVDLGMKMRTILAMTQVKLGTRCKLSVSELVAPLLQSVQVHSTRAPFWTMHR